MKPIYKFISIGLFLVIYSTSSNGATLNVSNGTLMGASGVNVNGQLYDVQFVDGTCIELYNGCDDYSDFPFGNPTNNATTLIAAMNALLEQVVIDSSLGNFDSNPNLINGCTNENTCNINTLLFFSGSTEFMGGSSARNSSNEFNDFVTSGSIFFNSNPNLALPPGNDLSVFAVWHQTTVVPVPSAIWLFSSGLIGLISFSRKKQYNLTNID